MPSGRVSTMDLAWVAGLLEGEGCFLSRGGKASGRFYPCIQITMNDEDVIRRLHEVLAFGSLNRQRPDPRNVRDAGMWRWQSTGRQAAGLMMTVYPLMGARRQERIRSALKAWLAHPQERSRKKAG